MTPEGLQRGIEAMRAGGMVILVDDEGRENEGDLCMAAQHVTPEAINFMATVGRGLICLTLTEARADALRLEPMVRDNGSVYHTAFTVSVEARRGVSTGISAADRAHTIRVALDDASGPADLVRPGHVFPLRARRGGVLTRRGQTEGSVDLAALAGLTPAGVICEIMNPDGSMARLPELRAVAAAHGLPLLSVAELVAHRLQHEAQLRPAAAVVRQHPGLGPLRLQAFCGLHDGREHLAVRRGAPGQGAPRLHVRAGGPWQALCGDLLAPADGGVAACLAASPAAVVVCLAPPLRAVAVDADPEAAAVADGDATAALLAGAVPDTAPRGPHEVAWVAQILRHLEVDAVHFGAAPPPWAAALVAHGVRPAAAPPLPAAAPSPRPARPVEVT